MCPESINSASGFIGNFDNLFQFLSIPIIFGIAGGFLFGAIYIFFKKF